MKWYMNDYNSLEYFNEYLQCLVQNESLISCKIQIIIIQIIRSILFEEFFLASWKVSQNRVLPE